IRATGIAPAPNVNSSYVTNNEGNSVTPIDVATNTTEPEIKVGEQPQGIAITPDGKTAYVVNFGFFESGSVTPINVATNKAETEINVGPFPFGVAITPDGK